MSEPRATLILEAIDDLVANFLYYDRKEDRELPMGAIEAAIEAGEITTEQMAERFKSTLENA